MFGKVRNFSWEAQTDGSYRCTVEIISLGDIIDSLKINVTPLVDVDKETSVADNDSLSASNIFTTILDFIKHRAILVPETPQSVSSNNPAIALDIDGTPLPVNTSPKVGYKTGFVLVSDDGGILPGGLKNSKIKLEKSGFLRFFGIFGFFEHFDFFVDFRGFYGFFSIFFWIFWIFLG